MSTSPTALIRKRVSRACDNCHARGIKCNGNQPCSSCVRYADDCKYLRPVKRRGKAPKRHTSLAVSSEGGPVPSSSQWSAPEVLKSATVPALLDYARQSYHTIFPFFHWPSILSSISSNRHLSEPAFCAFTLSICALSSARLRGLADAPAFFASYSLPPQMEEEAAAFTTEAEKALSLNSSGPFDFDLHRACLLLVLCSIQNNKPTGIKYWLGQYVTLCGVSGLHDESLWPSLLSHEIEERRRCVWTGLQLEVYAGLTWGGPIRHRAAQIHVHYPTEMDDDELDLAISGSGGIGESSWLHGWNRTTDLYRILERALNQFRAEQLPRPHDPVAAALESHIEPSVFTGLVDSLHQALPLVFKEFELSSDLRVDRFRLQAVNFLMTSHNIRLLVLCSSGFGVDEAITVAKQLLASLTLVPAKYLAAMNLPLYQQLSGIGMLLASAVGWTRTAIVEMRNVLSGICEILDMLGKAVSFSENTNDRLKQQIGQLDNLLSQPSSPVGLVSENGVEVPVQGFWDDFLPFDLFQTSGSEEVQDYNLLFPDLFSEPFLDSTM